MKLADMTPRNVHKWQQFALTRLQLRFTAETQKLYADFADWLGGVVLSSADGEGYADGVNLYGKLPAINTRWHKLQVEFTQLFKHARIEAASIPFGALVVQHNAKMQTFDKPVETSESLTTSDVDTLLRLWRERRSRMLEQAAQRVYSDGLVLSQRIWQLENGGFDEIRSVINHAFIERTSAVKLSKDAAHLLGAGQNCPRWAYSRLYGMTAADRLEDTAGLLKGDECNSTGLSYKALRMARNEIQHAHHAMNDDILRHSPWVVGEKIFLSGYHPKPDECDEYAAGGPYEAGSVILPLHIQCMCGKLSVNMNTDDFIAQVRGWMAGENDFLDDYSQWLGVADPASIIDWGLPLAEALEIWTEQTRAAHSVALGVR